MIKFRKTVKFYVKNKAYCIPVEKLLYSLLHAYVNLGALFIEKKGGKKKKIKNIPKPIRGTILDEKMLHIRNKFLSFVYVSTTFLKSFIIERWIFTKSKNPSI